MGQLIDQYKGISSKDFEAKLIEIGAISEQFLRFLPREIRTYPSHGYDHTRNIIKYIPDFLEKWGIRLNEIEIFLLYAAAWVHDIGCLVERDKHNMRSSEIISREKFFSSILTKEQLTSLKYIVEAHSSSNCPYPINKVPKEWGDVRLRFICSIFRIMDACDITDANCPSLVYKIIQPTLGEESERHWKAHLNVEKLTFRHPYIAIYVDKIEECRFLIDHLYREIELIQSVFNDYEFVIPIIQIISKSETITLQYS